MAHTLPAATGFLASVQQDGDRRRKPGFASRGSITEAREERGGRTLRTSLLHSGAPQGALARADSATVLLAGELYNQSELHSLLPPVVAPESDAELLLALFEIYDLHVFRLLNGRFAALVDTGG